MIGLELAMWQDEVLAQEHKRRHEEVTPENEQVKALFEDWEKSYPWEKEAFSMGKSRLIGMKEVCAAFEAGYHSANGNRWHYPSKAEDMELFYAFMRGQTIDCVNIYCKLRLGYTNRCVEAAITKIEIVDGKNTDLHIDAPVYAIHLANIQETANK